MRQQITTQLVIREELLRERLLPLLRERVFHVTSRERLNAIIRSGRIDSNQNGDLGNTFPQSQVSIARARGYVCLFDLRRQAIEAIDWGLDCFYFLAPPPLGNEIAFLLLAPAADSELIRWEDIRGGLEPGAFHIPDVECWFAGNLPLDLVDEILAVRVVRRPVLPGSLAAALEQLDRERNPGEGDG